MKNMVKLFGIIAFITIAGFAFVACDNGTTGDGVYYGTQDQPGNNQTPPVHIAVTGVTLAPATPTISVGRSLTLTAEVMPSNATNMNVTFNSSDTTVATVLPSGIVTAVSPGTAIITVITVDGGYTDTSSVTVTVSLFADFIWIEAGGVISITGWTGTGNSMIIPVTIYGYLVTTIWDNAFSGNNLTNVTIPNSITSIGSSAFNNNNNLTIVTIGNGVTLGYNAFPPGITSLVWENNFNDVYGGVFGTFVRLNPVANSTVWTRQ